MGMRLARDETKNPSFHPFIPYAKVWDETPSRDETPFHPSQAAVSCDDETALPAHKHLRILPQVGNYE